MAADRESEATTLRLTHTFAAPREKVFRAWTDPQALKQWWIPADGFSVPSAEIDLRVGGGYRVAMRSQSGEIFYLVGTYREVRPPERLVYTWRWEETEMNVGETLVTVEFRRRGSSTEVAITHSLFPNGELRDRHAQGWSGCLDRLARTIDAAATPSPAGEARP
jgi:uncharacterized protein YndB with AHSA1/START domain